MAPDAGNRQSVEAGATTTVIAMLASHNRRQKTVRCLTSLFDQSLDPAVRLRAVLVDGGSDDGTAAAVAGGFPDVDLIEGGEDLYWAGAMALAERSAMASSPDFLFWLNDDVVLDRDALARLIETSRSGRGGRCIAVGAMRDPSSGALTYSGLRRRGWHPLRHELFPPGAEPVEVETFNGNSVLVPIEVRLAVGPMDGGLVHSAADLDYGLRARRTGFANLLAPGTVGTCERDGGRSPWLDSELSLRERLALFLGPKGFPPRPRARYLRRHGGPAWPVIWLWTYLRRLPAVVRAGWAGDADA